MYYLVNFENSIPKLDGMTLVGNVGHATLVKIEGAAALHFDYKAYGAVAVSADVDTGLLAVGQVKDEITTSKDGDFKVKTTLTDAMRSAAVDIMKEAALYVTNLMYTKKFAVLLNAYSDAESYSWTQQIEEAKAVVANPSAPSPLLTALAAARGLPVSELAVKVLEKSAAFETGHIALLSKLAAVNQSIKACATVRDCNRVYETLFGYQMPKQQAIEDGLADANGFRTTPVPAGYTFLN